MAQPISFPLMSSSIILPSPTFSSITAFFILCVPFTRSLLLHIHITNASNRFCSFRRSALDSEPYNATLHTKHFTSLFRGSFSKGPQKMLLFLLKAYFAIAILCFTSWQQFMLLLILHPKYLKLYTCTTYSSLIRMSIFFGFLPITMVLVIYTVYTECNGTSPTKW